MLPNHIAKDDDATDLLRHSGHWVATTRHGWTWGGKKRHSFIKGLIPTIKEYE